MAKAEAQKLATVVAANAPLSVAASKRAVDELTTNPNAPDMSQLDKLVQACFDSEDYEEGRRAFAEKMPAAVRWSLVSARFEVESGRTKMLRSALST